VQTAAGVESISPHEIHVGQRFTITFHRISPSAANWYVPSIAKKVSPCRTGVDLTCKYVAQAVDVTYPAAATYDGWSEFKWGGGDVNGLGYGYDYYAIIGNSGPLPGGVEDKHGHGIPRGGVPAGPNGSTPDAGVLIVFTPVKHGVPVGVQRRAQHSRKPGSSLRRRVFEVLARVPRDELEAVERQDGKLVSVLKLRFTNGVLWEFDIPRTAKKNAKQFVAALGGTVI
jgi:hypothetical protein